MDGVLLLSAALALGGVFPFARGEVLAVVAVVVTSVVARARRERVQRRARSTRRALVAIAFAALALTLGAGRAARAVGAYEAAREEADVAFPTPLRCAFTATVTSSPVRIRGAPRWSASATDVTCDAASSDARAAWAGVVTLYGGPDGVARGDVLHVVAQLAPPQRLWNEVDPRPMEARGGVVRSGGVVDARIVMRGRGAWALVDRARAHVRRRIDASFPEATAGMARALVLGETDLAAEDDAAFRASGLAHLLAVSGMHLVLVVMGLVAAARAILVRIEPLAARLDVGRIVALAMIPVAWIYSELAGASGSARRAAWMLAASLGARALGRRSDGARAFALSMLAMAAVDPLVAFDVSFVLSAAATAGLLVLSRPLGDAIAARVPKALDAVARSAAATLAATIPCAPVLARMAPSLPLGGVVANLVAVPLGETLALPLCLVHALLGPWPAAEKGCALAGGGALWAVRAVAHAFANATWLAMPIPPPTAMELAIVGAAFAWALLAAPGFRRSGLLAFAALLLVAEIGACRAARPNGALRATFLDVGQGDAALVDLPDGQALLIDGGGLVGSPVDVGARVLAPSLRARRRSALALAILSHPHPDHFGGLPAGLEGVRVGALWDTGQGEREGVGGGYAALLARAARDAIPVVRPPSLCGMHVVGGARIDVLAPCPSASPDRSPNDNSLVVRIAFGTRAFLFVGDAEREEEADLLALPAERLRADVLKVGHHGSRTSSSPPFLRAVAPQVAIVSSGVRNRFGHPHPATLAALAEAKIRTLRTDREGAITVTTDGDALTVETARGRAPPLPPPPW